MNYYLVTMHAFNCCCSSCEWRVDPCLVFNNFSFLSILFLYRSIPISLSLNSASTITSFIVFLGQRYFIKAALSHIRSVGSSMTKSTKRRSDSVTRNKLNKETNDSNEGYQTRHFASFRIDFSRANWNYCNFHNIGRIPTRDAVLERSVCYQPMPGDLSEL